MDIAKRVAGLSPERRRALARLASRHAASSGSSEGIDRSAEISAEDAVTALSGHTRRFYESISEELDRSEVGRFARFLNYGYQADENAQLAVVDLPPHLLNRASVKLVLELVGDCPLQDRRVLDVGCGRGGLLETLQSYFGPRRLVGLDLCWNAVASASRAGGGTAVFVQGDAQRLPFGSGSFDVITNLESSHTYLDVHCFYDEVARVLTAGGNFLYSDAIPQSDVRNRLAALAHVGLRLEIERDITANVLAACDAFAAQRMATFSRSSSEQRLDEFIALPGSGTYEALRTRQWLYVILRFRRT